MSTQATLLLDPEALNELAAGSVLRMEPGERLWKLYFLRPAANPAAQAEHRIYTKLQADGRICLASYTVNATHEDGPPIRSNLAIVRDIPEDTLNQLIWQVVRQSQIGPDELEVIDLTSIDSFEAQVGYLRGKQA
ncbi:MAG TPA: hypothetical protein PKM78_04300 [Anaerolineae bacterium]|nr:hypothetical protein [Anaerolineae bacterium]HNU05297.1 hypothetical protein [Anaerolineae bacterium]